MALRRNLQRLLYKIARAYYIDELTQQQIAIRFRISRPKVSRLLKQARQEKIVTISVVPPSRGMGDIETKLEKKFGLDEVAVVTVSDSKNLKTVAHELGPAAAEVFIRSLQGNEIVSLAWGSTTLGMIDALPTQNWNAMTIVQMIGGLGPVSAGEHSAELVRSAAQKLGAQFRLLPAPGILSNLAASEALKSDSQISETLELASKASVAVIGMGVLSPDSILLQIGRILNQDDKKQLEQAGAVGDVVLRYLDANGHPLNLEMDDRILGLTIDQIKKIPRVIGIAGGEKKFDIILAALRNHIIDVLVTDHVTAQKLLETD